jgi:hypothetical protein
VKSAVGRVEIQRNHLHRRAGGLGQLVDRGAARLEIGDHLHRDLGRKGRHALRRDP